MTGYTITVNGKVGRFPTYHDREDAAYMQRIYARRYEAVTLRVVTDTAEPVPPKGLVFGWLPPGSPASLETVPIREAKI